jgi:hypothetical protein
MPARDSLVLREYINKHEPGVDMKIDFKCNCAITLRRSPYQWVRAFLASLQQIKKQ